MGYYAAAQDGPRSGAVAKAHWPSATANASMKPRKFDPTIEP